MATMKKTTEKTQTQSGRFTSLDENKLRGGYYTSSAIADWLCAWAIRSPKDRVLEPSCGDGAFLEAATKRFSELGTRAPAIARQLPLIRQAVDTPWARLPESKRLQRIKANTLKILWALDKEKDPESCSDKAGDWSRNLAQQLKPMIEQIGLRKLWRTENKVDTALVVRRLLSA